MIWLWRELWLLRIHAAQQPIGEAQEHEEDEDELEEIDDNADDQQAHVFEAKYLILVSFVPLRLVVNYRLKSRSEGQNESLVAVDNSLLVAARSYLSTRHWWSMKNSF